jgi:3-deoxy-D-manno-octulosonic acid kinase
MQPSIHNEKSLAIAYDASLMQAPGVDYFNVDFWRAQKALTGEAIGRGSVWLIDTPSGPVVLRQYLRGGWVARFNRQSYFFSTVKRCRPFREFHLLAALYQQGLPVPRPVAALCEHHGIISTGALMTARISAAQTLADILSTHDGSSDLTAGPWGRVGSCIRRFHEAGVWHADLNARNILLDAELRVFLIDFDRARFTPGKAVQGEDNLNRLKRSLLKLWPPQDLSALNAVWTQLKAGYRG